MSEYYDDAPTRILQAMRDTLGKGYNYFDGPPNEELPEAAFPCVIVHKVDGDVSLGASSQDVIDSRINVHVLLNQADDINAAMQGDTTAKRLRYLIEGRDPVTAQWKEGTVMHQLRTHITLENVTVELAAAIAYDTTPRPDLPTITEAIIQLTTREWVTVPERY